MKVFFEEYLVNGAMWLFFTYLAVVVAMAVDLVSGIWKSRRLGRRCNSRGLKRTCEKAGKYFLPMICLTCVDFLGSVFCRAPYLTMCFAGYCIFCELVSVMESTHEKGEMQRVARLAEVLSLCGPDVERLCNKLIDLIENEKDK